MDDSYEDDNSSVSSAASGEQGANCSSSVSDGGSLLLSIVSKLAKAMDSIGAANDALMQNEENNVKARKENMNSQVIRVYDNRVGGPGNR